MIWNLGDQTSGQKCCTRARAGAHWSPRCQMALADGVHSQRHFIGDARNDALLQHDHAALVQASKTAQEMQQVHDVDAFQFYRDQTP